MFTYAKKSATNTVVVIATALIAIGSPVVTVAQNNTQDSTDERIRACGEIEDATDRMDCFNVLVEGLNEVSDVPDASPNEVNAATASAIAADSEAAAMSTKPASVPASAASPAAAGAAGATITSAESEVDDFGLEEQKAAEAKPKEQKAEIETGSVHATITGSEKSGLNHFVVVLDNGQVWEETDGSRRMGLPRIGTPVEVYKGKIGGYRMKFGGDNRVAWVRRLK